MPALRLPRLMALSEGYQAERPNVETSDMMALVIRALGTIVGKMVKESAATNNEDGEYRKQHFLTTTLITSAAQQIVEVEEIDIHNEYITTGKAGRLLTKMRLPKGRQGNIGKRGWYVSLYDVRRWASSYGLEPEKNNRHSHTTSWY